ncbi:unnamed protein product [Allacma fusca]|uniref:Uncharacterized protein n=1 Tax=Allacma fusca TaxID=39272 RepID=A0A8J2L6V6_9HEXA|nr:unnamed protein product [Allacma fusca]
MSGLANRVATIDRLLMFNIIWENKLLTIVTGSRKHSEQRLSLECIGSHLTIGLGQEEKTQFEITPEEDLNFGMKFHVRFQKENENLSKVVVAVPESAKILLRESKPAPKIGIHIRKLKTEKKSTIFNVMEESKPAFGSKNQLLSLRDFLKLCRSIPRNLDFTKPASAVKIFHEWVDLFDLI